MLGILLAAGSCFVAFGLSLAQTDSEISELQESINAKKVAIDELQEKIKLHDAQRKALQDRALSLENQIALLNNRIEKTELDIQLLETQIEQTALEIKKVEEEIALTAAKITKHKEQIAVFLRTLHQEDERSLLEVLLTNDSLNEFFDRLLALESIQADIKETVDQLKTAKYELEAKQKLLEAKKMTLEKNQADMEEKQTELEDNKDAKQAILVETRDSEAHFQSMVSQLKQEQISINAEIRNLESNIREKIEQAGRDKLEALGPARLQWPVPSRYITAYFHDPTYLFRKVFEHPAVDVRASHGTPVRAAESGFVGRAKTCSTATCYAYVMIIHNDGLATVYGHLSQVTVSEDQFVNKGEIIGLSGATPGTVGAGRLTTGPHLHFEVRQDGIPVNPLNYLP